MKRLFLITAILFSTHLYGEQLGSYKASNGKLYELGDTIKLSRGSGNNGSFVYLSVGGIGFAANGGTGSQVNYTFANTNVVVKKIKKDLSGRVFFSVGGGGLTNYTLDIENAISMCEIVDCNSTKQNSPSKLDELKKLKELLDAGVLTQDEFNAEKAKLLK